MAVSLKTQKMLWGRAASRCSICRQELVMDESEIDDASLVGEASHIVARKPDGPRGKSTLTTAQRDKYANLLLLCNAHHKQVDDQPNQYTVEELHQIKREHESWVKESLAIFDEKKQRDDEIYAGYVDDWANMLSLNEWKIWASMILFHGQPSLRKEIDEKIPAARDWLLSRVWPKRYPELEDAFTNFRVVLQDFHNVFHEHALERGDGVLQTEKFYQIKKWDEERYRKLADEFHYHVALVEDLILELTRAANYVCDMVREYLVHSYRLREGVLLIEAGPFMPDLHHKTYRAEYRGEERIRRPYPGLQAFKDIRFTRDFYFGEKGET